jgi:uncharacterized membrane protein YgcG
MLLILPLVVFSFITNAQNKKTYDFFEVPRFEDKLVYDDAGLLNPETTDRLEQRLRRVQDSSGYQVAVLIIHDLSGIINSYARKVIYEWKLGDRKEQKCVLMLIVQQKREVRIEVGKGLIDKLTPEECESIIDHAIIPNFKEEKYNEGSIAAVQGIIAGLGGTYNPPQTKTNYNMIFLVVAIIAIVASCVGLFSKHYFVPFYAGLIPFYAVFVSATFNWWVVGAFVAGFPLVRWILVKSKVKLLTFGAATGNGSGGSYEEDEYDRMQRRRIFDDSSDDSSSSSSSSSDSSGGSGHW